MRVCSEFKAKCKSKLSSFQLRFNADSSVCLKSDQMLIISHRFHFYLIFL
jgi:hypothetical protein